MLWAFHMVLMFHSSSFLAACTWKPYYCLTCASKLLLFGVYHSLAIATEGEFSIGTISDIQKLCTIPLNEQPRKICHQEQSRTLAVCSFKYDHDSKEQSEAHFIRLLDHQTLESLSTHPLDQYMTVVAP